MKMNKKINETELRNAMINIRNKLGPEHTGMRLFETLVLNELGLNI